MDAIETAPRIRALRHQSETKGLLRRLAIVATCAAALVMGLATPHADAADVSASLSGNTVNYSANGLPPNTDVTVTIKNETTASSTTYTGKTSETGSLPTSTGTTGDDIDGGTTVSVTVKDKDGNQLASASVKKPKPKNAVLGVLGWVIDWIL